ncbi:zinc-dependent alcohol dehydrogenase family protein [Draconibacterium sp. IB214405]|uniref:zinc-dependent alcohol dehydrogenase family protein n=1 Tax=Draconibacterium sp. IB214405 TaxID=3097352 RepID=UPI002A1398EE|nr:zinc-dependent alcohol dehydrogenase family protein [Draconibacterium sp. IB214405]MDX8339561.1 zinc-dependent alcohol dehydrogenase family protein [Draconibacterium sp. IB214405]
MKAVYYEEFQGKVDVREVPNPAVSPDSVIVKVEATGLCRSDWHGWMGHDPDIILPHVPGHELAGTIAEVGSEIKNFKVGDRVTVPFVSGCGCCPECQTGNQQVCDNQFQPGFTAWGSFAELVEIKYADINLVLLPDEIDFVTAASLGCRFITSFRAVIDQGKVTAGQWVAVHGCGGVGLSAINIASGAGANVIAVDIDDEKLQLAKKLGANVLINAKEINDVPAEIVKVTGRGAHLSIDALGSQETCFNSISCLRKRGKHVQVGLTTADHKHPKVPMDKVVAHEIEILGSHGMQAFRYNAVFEMIKKGKVHPELMLGKTISLKEAPEALVSMNEFENLGVTVINNF